MIKDWIRKNAVYNKGNSIAYRCRKKRMEIFERFYKEQVLADISENSNGKILDLGGSFEFWKVMGFKYIDMVSIVLLNLEKYEAPEECKNISIVIGDATDLSQYGDKQFDVVFSNSVIEHVGGFENQQKMAEEMKRVGKHCFLQTPNKYFVIEPHFLFPFFSIMPLKLKVFCLKKFDMACCPRAKTNEEAFKYAESVRLMTKKELKSLFPGVKIRKEKFFFMTKSFYLYY